MNNVLLKISILNIGDELLIGQTLNTNAAWIGRACTDAGVRIVRNVSVSDDAAAITAELDISLALSDIILVTGGLGPTHDDITKKVLASYFHDELLLNEEVLSKLKESFRRRKREFLPAHEQMALMPRQAAILNNDVGTAQGMMWKKEGKIVISMPGVPLEMKFIMQGSVLPLLKRIIEDKRSGMIYYATLVTAGVPESVLAEKIGDHTLLFDGSLAYLPSYKGVRLRLGIAAENFAEGSERMKEILMKFTERIGEHVIGQGEEELTGAVAALLKEKKLTVSVAESCTGGKLAAALTDLAGSSAYFAGGVVSYSNESKQSLLEVGESTIEKFGAVSEETALEMCRGVRMRFRTDYSVSITGIAGPDGGSEEKPVGTVWIGIDSGAGSYARLFRFGANREMNRDIAVHYALYLLYKEIKGEIN